MRARPRVGDAARAAAAPSASSPPAPPTSRSRRRPRSSPAIFGAARRAGRRRRRRRHPPAARGAGRPRRGRLPRRRRRHGGRAAVARSAGWSASRWSRCRRRVGYGASFGGLAALLAMLNSCAPGVAVCNIDNGFGAGVFAARVAPAGRQRRDVSRVGWFHCLAGACGDMLLGALVDAGVPLETLQAAVDAVGVEPIAARGRAVQRHGLGATKVDVRGRPVDASSAPGRTSAALLEAADLADAGARRRARRLRAAGRAPRRACTAPAPTTCTSTRSAALDALADVVGVAAGLHALGLDAVHASPVAAGRGMARGAHGWCRSPAPAVLELLAGVAASTAGGVAHEMCTPTGAALLAATVRAGASCRRLVVGPRRRRRRRPRPRRAAQRGAAGRGRASRRGQRRRAGWPAVVLEANVDDLDPRLWPGVLAALLAAGAVDAWLTPILMKKGRPAVTGLRAGRRRNTGRRAATCCSARRRRSAYASTPWRSTRSTVRSSPWPSRAARCA